MSFNVPIFPHEDNFMNFYSNYFKRSVTDEDKILHIRECAIPSSLTHFILWIHLEENLSGSNIYFDNHILQIRFDSRNYPIIETIMSDSQRIRCIPSSDNYPKNDKEIELAIKNSMMGITTTKEMINNYTIDDNQYACFENMMPDIFDLYCLLRDNTNIKGIWAKNGEDEVEITYDEIWLSTDFLATSIYTERFDKYDINVKISIINGIINAPDFYTIQTNYFSYKINTAFTVSNTTNYVDINTVPIMYDLNKSFIQSVTLSLSLDNLNLTVNKRANVMLNDYFIIIVDSIQIKNTWEDPILKIKYQLLPRRIFDNIFSIAHIISSVV